MKFTFSAIIPTSSLRFTSILIFKSPDDNFSIESETISIGRTILPAILIIRNTPINTDKAPRPTATKTDVLTPAINSELKAVTLIDQPFVPSIGL
ncbi:hypothetical protein SDC9_107582 [bioreactor metagenome]|uniref:Uncharacterized protein n=1 Tax=bioreactor metagenome TaxID=1076179 RepID=A0A645B5L5_9ZZZZ